MTSIPPPTGNPLHRGINNEIINHLSILAESIKSSNTFHAHKQIYSELNILQGFKHLKDLGCTASRMKKEHPCSAQLYIWTSLDLSPQSPPS